jgi:hypothetical protein
MIVRLMSRVLGIAAVAGLLLASGANAQQAKQVSPAAIETAKQILEVKGAFAAFDPVVEGVIRFQKQGLVQANPNPNLPKDADVVEGQLIKEYAPRRQEVRTEVARAYAAEFTEQELKDLLAFYKSPLGKKVIEGEPKAFDSINTQLQAWADKFATEVGGKMRAELKKKGYNEF